MPEVNFTIDTETGEMEIQIEGIQGTACSDVAKRIKELLGQPQREGNTREFYARPTVKPQIQNQKKA